MSWGFDAEYISKGSLYISCLALIVNDMNRRLDNLLLQVPPSIDVSSEKIEDIKKRIKVTETFIEGLKELKTANNKTRLALEKFK